MYKSEFLSACASPLLLAVLVALVPAADKPRVPADHVEKMRAGAELFRKAVGSILRKNCLACHGGESTKGDFDLATRETMLASGMLDLDAPAQSQLLAVIRHQSEPHMPKDAAKLSNDAIDLIAQWIEFGASFDKPLVEHGGVAENTRSSVSAKERQFWSFRPLRPVAPPADVQSPWVRNAIDQFVLEKLQAAQLTTNSIADRRRLMRRAYFDLIGLPPSPEEAASFIADTDEFAYERMIDRLLDSPHYGERWARHWMDIARFGESHGYEQDYDRPHAFHYRDFLIKALNADMPFDRFVQLQIAGDELEPENSLALMATGFLGAGVFPTQLTEAEFETSRYDELDDMVNTLGNAILGLSIGCARCHAHKFDPISSMDYYRLLANFATTIRSEIDVDLDPEENLRLKHEYELKLAAAQRSLGDFERNELQVELQNWLVEFEPNKRDESTWSSLAIDEVQASGKKIFKKLKDQSYVAQGAVPAKQTIVVTAHSKGQAIGALRLEALTDDAFPKRGPGRADNGNFVVTGLSMQVIDANSKPLKQIEMVAARATHQQNAQNLGVAAVLDNDPNSGWAVDGGGIGNDQAAVFDLAQSVRLAADQRLQISIRCEHPNGKHILGRFRLSVAAQVDLPASVGPVEIPIDVRDALQRLKMVWDISGQDYSLAKGWFSSYHEPYARLKKAVAELLNDGPPQKLSKVQVSTEGLPHMPHHADGRGFPHFYPNVFYLNRGDVHQKKESVQAGFLQILSRDDHSHEIWQVEKPANWTRTSFRRATLARWLTDVQFGAGNLAARVIVNRLWQHHFGTGIVATPNDFGAQGELPTHPELLEWLAVDLVQHGWQLKRLHKLIMTSATYMQSSDYDPERAKIDRENRLWWRFPTRRVEAEVVRDTMLSVSGRLDSTPYGPGSLDSSMRRRSIYFFIKRSQLIPMMVLFDWPEHQVSIGQRSRTTVAPQALALMNSSACRDFAESLAERIGSQEFSYAADQAYQLAFSRLPTLQEKELMLQFYSRQLSNYMASNATDAKRLALIDFCQVVLSMNELIYID